MQLTLEEMNILATCLEKEQAKLREGKLSSKNVQELKIIQQLQRKLEDLQHDLSLEEKSLISTLLQEEQSHLYGHEIASYETIQHKLGL